MRLPPPSTDPGSNSSTSYSGWLSTFHLHWYFSASSRYVNLLGLFAYCFVKCSFFKMTECQNFDLLHNHLVVDFTVVAIIKIIFNHNIEFAVEMFESLNLSTFTFLTLSAEAIDFIFYAYFIEYGFVRLINVCLILFPKFKWNV